MSEGVLHRGSGQWVGAAGPWGTDGHFWAARDEVGKHRSALERVQGCGLAAAGFNTNGWTDALAFSASPCATATMRALLWEARSGLQWPEARVQGDHPRPGPSLGGQKVRDVSLHPERGQALNSPHSHP